MSMRVSVTFSVTMTRPIATLPARVDLINGPGRQTVR
jgi:hypothetical protein